MADPAPAAMRPVARPGWRLAGWMTLAAALLGLVGWPVGRLVAEGLRGGAERLLAAIGPDGWAAVGNSLWTSAAVTVLAMTGALAVALLTTRTSLPGRRWLQLALLVPLVVPDFVSAISWTRAYGPAGLGQRLLGVELPGLYGPLGIVLVLAGGALPLALLVILGGLAVRAEPDLERAARASGASRFTAFRTVTLPLLAPVLAAAAGLVFLTTMNAFGTPAVLGRPAGFATMTTRIYQDLAFSSSDDAFLRVIALSCLLLAVAVAAVAAGDRAGWLGVVRGGGSPGPRGSVSAAGWAAGAVAWLAVIVAVGIPLLALVLTALTRAVGLAPTPENLTLDNFARALDRHALAAIGNTLVLAAATAVGAVGLGLLAVATARGAWRRRLATLVTVTFALPGSVLAVAVLLAYGASLRDTLAIILVAYLAKLWALGHRPVAAAVEGIPSDLLRAARVHGATPLGAARTVLLPILAPALAAAALLVFVFAVHEVTISILLYGPTSATLAVSILNLQQLGDPTLTSALAVLLTVVVSGLAGGLVLLVRGRRLLVERAA